jgi:chorismate mutase
VLASRDFCRIGSREQITAANRTYQTDQTRRMTDSATDPQLAAFRRSIDNIDAALIHMLAERFRITQAVGEYKASTALPPADPDREARQIARLRKLATEADLDPEFSEKFIRFVIDEVIRHHRQAAIK